MKRALVKLLTITVILLLLLTACSHRSRRYVGEYGGLVDDGVIGKWIFVRLELNGDGTAQTNVFGTEQSGDYKIEDNILTLTLYNEWGYGVSLTGQIWGDEITFEVATELITLKTTLKKGRTYVDLKEVIDSLNREK